MSLVVSGLTKTFGGIAACLDVNVTVEQGEIVGIIGPNGAGKTTLFDCLTGAYKIDAGKVLFFGQRIDGLGTDRTTSLGLARTFQLMRLFRRMTVVENVMVGAFCRTSNLKDARRTALEKLTYVGLVEKQHAFANQLSTGQRKRLELARALATQPRMLLMDEVTAGVDPTAIPGLLQLVRRLQQDGLGLLIIEHNMRVLREIAPRFIAMDGGRVIADGPATEVVSNEQVISSYLGTSYAKAKHS
jgi:branched-chain amino acid transport system ATP-binding protein